MSETSDRPRAMSIYAQRRDAVLRRRRALGLALGIAGLAVSVFAFALTIRPHPQVAQHYAQGQVAPSDQTTGQNQSPPAEAKPGGTRPTTPAPEPARPDPEAQKQGAPAALPPAPAEKTAPPISR